MLFTDKIDLISLPYKPRKTCFSKAQMEWRGIVLNGMVSEDKPIVDLSEENLEELLFELFGSLEFTELSELYKAISSLEALSSNINWDSFFKMQKTHFNQRNIELFEKLNSLPDIFRNWTFDRKLSASDLMPINSLKDLELFSSLSALFSEMNFGRNEGKKIIDILVDLILMGKSREDLVPSETQPWFQQLQQLRYPQTTKRDASEKSSQWPEFVQVQNKRAGDHLSYNMQIQYKDSEDLTRKLERLTQMSQN